ncbi:MAG TPA: hypothetical protein VFF65_01945 [Phycisphaerales bacterium]|nr:hypothetical protein [Phycisphaerales bacterium]
MNRSRLTLTAALVTLAAFAPALAQPASGARQPAASRPTRTSQAAPALRDNAALVYYSVWTTMSADDAKVFAEHAGMQEFGKPLPTPFHEALVRNQTLISRLVKGASLQHCDFARDRSEGFNLLLPELAKMRGLVRILKADAQRLLLEGKPDDAADRYAAIYGISRHAAQDRILISSLVSIAIAGLPTDDLAERNAAAMLTPKGRQKVLAAIERLNGAEGFNLKGAMEGERELMVYATIEKYQGADAGRRFADECLSMTGTAPTSKPHSDSTPTAVDQDEVTALERVRQMDGAALAAEARKLEPFYEAVVKAWDRTDAQKALQELSEAATRGDYGAFGGYLLPALSKCHLSESKGVESVRKAAEALRKADAADKAAAQPAR